MRDSLEHAVYIEDGVPALKILHCKRYAERSHWSLF
jgi:hypothetical protein